MYCLDSDSFCEGTARYAAVRILFSAAVSAENGTCGHQSEYDVCYLDTIATA